MMKYMIKGVDKKLQAYKNFQYPVRGYVEAEDWNEEPICNNGLFGINEKYFKYNIKNYYYLIIAYEGIEIPVDNEKIKIQSGNVIFFSRHIYKIQMFLKKRGIDYFGYHSTLTGDDCSILTGSDCSKLTGGNCSKLTSSNYSELTGGNYSVLTGGYCSKLTGSDYSTLIGGDRSELTGGNYSTLIGGNNSTLTGGNCSKFIIYGSICTIKDSKNCALIMTYENRIYVKKIKTNKTYQFEIQNNKYTIKSMEIEE